MSYAYFLTCHDSRARFRACDFIIDGLKYLLQTSFFHAVQESALARGCRVMTLLPVRHEDERGQLWGGKLPPSSNHHRESAANGAFPLILRAYARNVCAYRARITWAQARYLILTVPIDTFCMSCINFNWR